MSQKITPPFAATPPPRRVPEAFLRAEIAAFPLAGEESFRVGLAELDPQLAEGGKSRAIWRACEGRLAPHTGWSLDHLVAARDRGWFGESPRSETKLVPMHSYLRTLARSHLSARAGVTAIEESTDLGALDAADRYRWLTFTLPEDLLLASLGVEPAPERVDLDPPLLVRRLLDAGLAEIHQHVGGGMDFPLLWASALAAIACPAVEESALASPGAPLAEGKILVRWLLAAAVARCVLAEFLLRGRGGFLSFVSESLLAVVNQAWTSQRRETLAAVFHALVCGADELLPDIGPLRDLYADIHPTALILDDPPLESLAEVYRRCDPIAARLDLHGRNAGERWFMRKGLAYLDCQGQRPGAAGSGGADPHDEYFARLFWQTVRVRCQYYRAIVQRPLTGGLQWFIRFYGRLGRLRDPLDRIRPEVSFSVAARGHPIRALELRTSLGDTAVAIGDDLLSFLQSWQRVLLQASGSVCEPEMGLVYHFAKDRDDQRAWSSGVPAAYWAGTFGEPEREHGMDVAHGRYGDYFVKQCRKAQALSELINAVPSSLWVIRGLDVANDELAVPTWVLAPLFRNLVEESAKVSIREQGLRPLKLTAHVGEDFRHLLEGMRRIYEHVHYVLDGASGRLGHAIALGVEPQAWSESVGSVLMPAEERLWDLVWEWRLYTRYRIRPEFAALAPPGRVDILLNKVRELADHIYGWSAYPVEALAEAHHMLHRFLVPPYAASPAVEGGYDVFLRAARNLRCSATGGRIHSPSLVGKIIENYLDNETVFRCGQMLVDVPVRTDEVVALTAVQNALRRGIAQNGIVIEVNPSSNLLIGDLLDLRNHPILRLFPPVRDEDGPPPVAIAVGSDDPVTFSTQLLREYTVLHRTACAAGYPERVVRDWLESIRQTGMDARFTLSWGRNAQGEPKINDLIKDLCRYLYTPVH